MAVDANNVSRLIAAFLMLLGVMTLFLYYTGVTGQGPGEEPWGLITRESRTWSL